MGLVAMSEPKISHTCTASAVTDLGEPRNRQALIGVWFALSKCERFGTDGPILTE
jgi:hypothetical protein